MNHPPPPAAAGLALEPPLPPAAGLAPLPPSPAGLLPNPGRSPAGPPIELHGHGIWPGPQEEAVHSNVAVPMHYYSTVESKER